MFETSLNKNFPLKVQFVWKNFMYWKFIIVKYQNCSGDCKGLTILKIINIMFVPLYIFCVPQCYTKRFIPMYSLCVMWIAVIKWYGLDVYIHHVAAHIVHKIMSLFFQSLLLLLSSMSSLQKSSITMKISAIHIISQTGVLSIGAKGWSVQC